MASGLKRFRPVAEADSSFHEDDYQSSKFARVRTRTRVPTRTMKVGGGLVSHSWAGESAATRFGGSSASIDAAGKNRVIKTATRTSNGSGSGGTGKGRTSTGVPGDNKSPSKSRMARNSRGGRASTGSLPRKSDEGKPYFKVKAGQKPRPMKWVLGSPAASSSPRQSKGKAGSTPKKKPPVTPRSNIKVQVPSTSYGMNTPEYMKIKEDESIVQEKKERKRRRNKVMSLKTSKGQPLMRGRIELMLDEIKATLTQ